MHGRAILAIWLSVVVLPAASAARANEWRREEARVFAARDGRLLYTETHWTRGDASPERWVLYRCADGKPFARKQVTPPAGIAPNFALQDARGRYREGVRGAAGGRIVYQQAAGAAEQARRLGVPADGVIDAGFDAAIRRHWEALMRGQVLQLQFLVPSRQRFFPVKVQRVGSIQRDQLAAERLRMTLDAWFGFAVPAVELVYARGERRLLEFLGTGNLRDARGRHPQVRIVFDAATRRVPRPDLDAARALPLTDACTF